MCLSFDTRLYLWGQRALLATPDDLCNIFAIFLWFLFRKNMMKDGVRELRSSRSFTQKIQSVLRHLPHHLHSKVVATHQCPNTDPK